ncbi:hypothetical protein [Paenibacillus naphthalenovorans]
MQTGNRFDTPFLLAGLPTQIECEVNGSVIYGFHATPDRFMKAI